MKNRDLLYNLKAALKEEDQDYFVELCYTRNITNASDYNNYHSLDVLKSTITEDNDTFITHLTRYITNDEIQFLSLFIKTNYQYGYEYYDVDEDNNEVAFDLYSKYEDELDADLIWDNAEKIIKDLEDYISINEE